MADRGTAPGGNPVGVPVATTNWVVGPIWCCWWWWCCCCCCCCWWWWWCTGNGNGSGSGGGCETSGITWLFDKLAAALIAVVVVLGNKEGDGDCIIDRLDVPNVGLNSIANGFNLDFVVVVEPIVLGLLFELNELFDEDGAELLLGWEGGLTAVSVWSLFNDSAFNPVDSVLTLKKIKLIEFSKQ